MQKSVVLDFCSLFRLLAGKHNILCLENFKTQDIDIFTGIGIIEVLLLAGWYPGANDHEATSIEI